MKTVVIARPENFQAHLDDKTKEVLSVTCQYEGYEYKFELKEPVLQKDINKIWAEREDDSLPPTPAQYVADCLAAAFFGASRTYHIRNIMNNFPGICGELWWSKIGELTWNKV